MASWLNRRALVAALVLAQLAVLAVMAGKREWIRANGEVVYLRTAPIDPRDPFRGDFVRLHYPFNQLHAQQLRGELGAGVAKGQVIYAELEAGPGGLYRVSGASERAPAAGPYLKGRARYAWQTEQRGGLAAKFGIEQYYVQQGKGIAIEQRRGNRDGIQVPMEMRVALGGDGTAVLTGYRWSQLGIGLEMLRFNRRGRDGELENPDQPASPKLRLNLQNVSDAPLLVDSHPCALALIAAFDTPERYPPASDHCADHVPQLRLLAPEQVLAIEVDLSEPRWWLRDGEQVLEIGALKEREMFRLVYQAPALEQAELEQAQLWRGELPSRAFNAMGRVD